MLHPRALHRLVNRDLDLNMSSIKESSEVHQEAVDAPWERAEQGDFEVG